MLAPRVGFKIAQLRWSGTYIRHQSDSPGEVLTFAIVNPRCLEGEGHERMGRPNTSLWL